MPKNLTESNVFTTPLIVPAVGDLANAGTLEAGFQVLGNRTLHNRNRINGIEATVSRLQITNQNHYYTTGNHIEYIFPGEEGTSFTITNPGTGNLNHFNGQVVLTGGTTGSVNGVTSGQYAIVKKFPAGTTLNTFSSNILMTNASTTATVLNRDVQVWRTQATTDDIANRLFNYQWNSVLTSGGGVAALDSPVNQTFNEPFTMVFRYVLGCSDVTPLCSIAIRSFRIAFTIP